LEERGELFILKEKSNRSDLSQNFWLYTKTLFTKEVHGACSQRVPELLAFAGTSSSFASRNFQQLSELLATLRAGTSSYF
jgi:hypothetical protein